MTDQNSQTPPPSPEAAPQAALGAAPPGPTGPRWMKIALVISVALNLAVAGLVLGAWLSDGPRKGMPRDMTFGPFSEALSDTDRKALRKGLMDRMGEFRTSREATRADFEALLVTLRADPFDPGAMTTALTAIETRNTERLALGRNLIATRIAEMTPEERQAFADRLEKGLRRGPKD